MIATSGRLDGQTLAGRYEIIDLIGVGGMGEVYRARDRELDDVIAVKLIRSDLFAQPEARDRFRNEVKLARRVTHRNVARAYELVTTEASTFYTMELIEGVSLARRIQVRGRVAIPDALEIVVEVCDALAAAHAVGVIHRDVKPENILLGDDGRIVLTDFGIAAAAHGSAELAGTPRYMAPEQARGVEPTVGADIYSLGVVFYELVAGRPAFAGSSLREIDKAKQQTEHLHSPELEPALDEALARATAREPQQRFHSAVAFRRALAPFLRPTGPARPSVSSMRRAAPLPTIVVRRAARHEAVAHLVEGAHQAIVDRLVQWPRLRVATRVPDDRIVEGLVDLTVGEDELALVANAHKNSLDLRLPFDIESLHRSADHAARVLAALMGNDAAVPPNRDHPMPPHAFELILRARHTARRDRSKLSDAVAWCEQALALAPAHPRIEAILATCRAQLAFYNPANAEALLDRASEHMFAALSRDPHLAEAHFARAHIELQRGRPVGAAVCFRMAIALAPQWAEAHEWLGRLLLEAGFSVDAHARFDDATSLGALPALGWELATALALEGRWDEVDATVARIASGTNHGHGYRLRFAAWRGVRDESAYRGFASLDERDSFEREMILAIHDPTLMGNTRRERIRAHVEASRVGSPRRQAFIAQLAAEAAGMVSDAEECLALLLHANACGLFDLPWLDRCPVLDPIRGEPRFAIIRNDVAERALAIHDALFGDHRDEATIATAAAR
jgi:serine/threonine-protein kinase